MLKIKFKILNQHILNPFAIKGNLLEICQHFFGSGTKQVKVKIRQTSWEQARGKERERRCVGERERRIHHKVKCLQNELKWIDINIKLIKAQINLAARCPIKAVYTANILIKQFKLLLTIIYYLIYRILLLFLLLLPRIAQNRNQEEEKQSKAQFALTVCNRHKLTVFVAV